MAPGSNAFAGEILNAGPVVRFGWKYCCPLWVRDRHWVDAWHCGSDHRCPVGSETVVCDGVAGGQGVCDIAVREHIEFCGHDTGCGRGVGRRVSAAVADASMRRGTEITQPPDRYTPAVTGVADIPSEAPARN
jgi:hypothetical protein